MELTVRLTDAQLAAIAERAAKLVLAQLPAADEWLTVQQAAHHAKCSPRRIYDLRSSGRLPRHSDGSRALVRRSDLDAYLAGASP